MSQLVQAKESLSCSHLETVQPFIVEESPALYVGIESPKVLDSSTLNCTSIDRSPIAVSSEMKSPDVKRSEHEVRGHTNNNREVSECTSRSDGASCSGTEATSDFLEATSSSTGGVGDADDGENDGATPKSSPSGPTSSSEGNSNAANSNKDDFSVSEETESDDSHVESSTEAGATGVQSTDSSSEEQTDSARQTGGIKNELANLVEKAILDFCSSRTVETMRRMFAGVTNDTETLQRDGGRHDDKSANAPHPVTGELVKEGIVIGQTDMFLPQCQREYILPLNDSFIGTLIREPGIYRAICHKTRCQIEVTRRLLNRKLCLGGRWRKYMIIRIVGATHKAIQNCDLLLQKAVKGYIQRKEYFFPAACRMFLREEVPDNADLYHSYQRTGGTCNRYGFLKLESPYRITHGRTLGVCPWKFGLWKPGKLVFSTPGANQCMKHVYPSQGYESSTTLEPEYQGVHAVDRIQALHELFHVKRQAALSLKRALTIPVCR